MDFSIDDAVAILERTPQTLSALLTGLPEPWIDNNEGPDTWSPIDVTKHLIHGEEEDWIPRIRIILAQGESQTFVPFDRFAFRDRSKGKLLPDLLDQFEALRKENLVSLAELKLTQTQLELRGKHPEFGTVTMSQLIATWATHDLSHIVQVARVMAKQYQTAVGPWAAYLSVLK